MELAWLNGSAKDNWNLFGGIRDEGVRFHPVISSPVEICTPYAKVLEQTRETWKILKKFADDKEHNSLKVRWVEANFMTNRPKVNFLVFSTLSIENDRNFINR